MRTRSLLPVTLLIGAALLAGCSAAERADLDVRPER